MKRLFNWFVSWFIRVLPGHNHYGRKMHLDCGACGDAFGKAVMQIIAATPPKPEPEPVPVADSARPPAKGRKGSC